MNELPKVSIVIPVHNCLANLEQTLLALKCQDYQGETEIIVVDNNSNDGSDEIAKQIPDIIVVYEKEIQNAAATRNRGIATAKGSIIAFLDGDCIPEKDWIKQAVNAIKQTGTYRIGGKIGVKPISPDSPVPALLDTLYSFNQEKLVNVHQAAMTRNLIVTREVFEKIGVFDNDFFEMEDIELGLRATKANIPINYVPECLVWHSPIMTSSEIFKKAKRNGKGTFILCNKNPQWSGRWGWKHPLRAIKTLITPRRLYWDTLPFDAQEITWNKKVKIYLGLWFLMNLGEAVGYFETWLNSLGKKQNV